MTELMYIENPDLFESSAQVTNHGGDSKGMYLVLNQSLFYPQGGGQPADQGAIIGANGAYRVFEQLPYEVPKDKALRSCCIAGFSPVPCGGIHVRTLADIASLEIKKCKNKKGKTKIYYEVQ